MACLATYCLLSSLVVGIEEGRPVPTKSPRTITANTANIERTIELRNGNILEYLLPPFQKMNPCTLQVLLAHSTTQAYLDP